MKISKNIAVFFFSLFCLNAFAKQGELGIRMMTSGDKGASFVSGSPLFKGETSSSASPEFFARFNLSNFSSSIPENLMIEGNISMQESVHDIKFNGASLGKKSCDQNFGANLQWWFGEKKSSVRPYIGVGFETRSYSGEYALGGAKFSQTESSSNNAVLRAGIKFDLSDLVAKGLSASIDLKTTSKYESSGTPVAGTTVTNKTGGGTSAGIGIQYSF